MGRKYTAHSSDLKLKVAIEAHRNDKTANEIASEYGVYPAQVSDWKRLLKESAADIFPTRRRKKTVESMENVEYLQQHIGKLVVELDWLKKKQGITE